MGKTREFKEKIIKSGWIAVEQLLEVAEEKIIDREPVEVDLDEDNEMTIKGGGKDISADRLKNAAATKKLAIFDAFDIVERLQQEQEKLDDMDVKGDSPEEKEEKKKQEKKDFIPE